MFIPLTSDTSLKHWPIATVSLIVVHIVVLVVQGSMQMHPLEVDLDPPGIDVGAQAIDVGEVPGWYDFMLSHGDGLHPVQWLTSMLMHDGWGHLVGNMIFLWVFGHLIEGIVGPFAFVGLYLGLGILQNFIGQLMFLGFPAEPSLGASGAIYSIMVLAALWAPQDNIQSLLIVTFRPLLIHVPILIMCLFYFLWDFGIALFQGFSLGTELLHVTGAGVGFAAGLGLLATGKIDCDERDMFSMIRDAAGRPKRAKARPKTIIKPREATADELQEKMRKLTFAWKTFDAHLVSGHPDSAIAQLHIVRKLDQDVHWDEPRLLNLIQVLQSHQRMDDVMRFSEIYLSTFSSRKQVVRLNMARILVVEKGLPRKALKMLATVDLSGLDAKNRQVAQNLERQCKKLIDEGTVETRDD